MKRVTVVTVMKLGGNLHPTTMASQWTTLIREYSPVFMTNALCEYKDQRIKKNAWQEITKSLSQSEPRSYKVVPQETHTLCVFYRLPVVSWQQVKYKQVYGLKSTLTVLYLDEY